MAKATDVRFVSLIWITGHTTYVNHTSTLTSKQTQNSHNCIVPQMTIWNIWNRNNVRNNDKWVEWWENQVCAIMMLLCLVIVRGTMVVWRRYRRRMMCARTWRTPPRRWSVSPRVWAASLGNLEATSSLYITGEPIVIDDGHSVDVCVWWWLMRRTEDLMDARHVWRCWWYDL